MRALQSEKLVKQVKHVYENVKYYRDLMDAKGVTPDDIKSIDDIHKLPFLTKADLRPLLLLQIQYYMFSQFFRYAKPHQ